MAKPVCVAVVGSRDYPNLRKVYDYIECLLPGTTVISGGARGVDSAAAQWAFARGLPIIEHKADWETHGKGAGFLRNQLIVSDCDWVVAFWDGKSSGTADTIARARAQGKPTIIIYP